MFTRKITGTFVAASLTAGALLTMPSATAAPTWTHIQNIGLSGAVQHDTASAVADNGDTVVAWIRDSRVMASSAKHGEFGPAYYVSDPEDAASRPNVAVNNHGDAVVTWVQDDNLGHARLAGNRREADGTFIAGHNYLSPGINQDVEGHRPEVALQENGTARIAYQSTDGATVHQIRLATWSDGDNTAATANISDTTAESPAVAVNESGTVLVGWYDRQGADSQIKIRRRPASLNQWETAKSASAVGVFGHTVKLSLSDSGNGTVAMVRKYTNGHFRAQSARINTNGSVTSASYITPVDVDAAYLDLDQNSAGTALLSFVQTDNGTQTVGYATRSLTGSWFASTLATPVDDPSATIAGIADDGTQLVAYTGGKRLLGGYRTNGFLPFTTFNSGDVNVDGGSTMGGIDDQGNAFVGGVVIEGDPTKGHAVGRFLDTAGATTWMKAPGLNTIGTKPVVSWGAADRLSELGTANVRIRTAVWNAGFGAATYPAQNTKDTSLDFEGKGGRTYCFTAQTRDDLNNLGPWAAEKCTTTPLDDGALTIAGGFKRVTSGNGYNGGYSVATTKGSSLRLTGVKASRLALLVSKVGTGGKVEVYFHGVKLGSYSLAGSGNKVVIPVATLDSVETGTVVIKVVSANGKTVRIDGLIAAK